MTTQSYDFKFNGTDGEGNGVDIWADRATAGIYLEDTYYTLERDEVELLYDFGNTAVATKNPSSFIS